MRLIPYTLVACLWLGFEVQASAHDDVHHGQTTAAEMEQCKRTIAFYEGRVAQDPEHLISWSKLGPLHLDLGRATGGHEHFLSAEAAFQRVLELNPKSTQAHIGIAYARLGRHAFASALEAARAAECASPGHLQVTALLGDIHFALGNYTEAEWAFERVVNKDATLQSYARLGLLHQVRGRMDRAKAAFVEAQRLGGELSATTGDLAWCQSMLGDLALQQGKVALAEKHYQNSLQLNAGNRAAVIGWAEVMHLRGQSESSIPQLKALVERSPEPKHQLTLARALADVGQAEAAQSLEQLALKDMLSDLEIGEMGHLRELVFYWLAHDGSLEQCLEIAQQDLNERRDVESLELAAWVHFKLGDAQAAADLMQEAHAWGGATRQSLQRASAIQAELGNQAHAEALLAQAEALKPVLPTAQPASAPHSHSHGSGGHSHGHSH